MKRSRRRHARAPAVQLRRRSPSSAARRVRGVARDAVAEHFARRQAARLHRTSGGRQLRDRLRSFGHDGDGGRRRVRDEASRRQLGERRHACCCSRAKRSPSVTLAGRWSPLRRTASTSPAISAFASCCSHDESLREPPSQTFGGIIARARRAGHRLSTVDGPRADPAESTANADRVLYAVDAKNDRPPRIDEGTQYTRDWIVDENGEPKFRLEYRQQCDTLTIMRRGERTGK